MSIVTGSVRMFSGDYGWMPKKDIKPRVKLFADDDFKFFVFMSIFIFCLAGLVLLITGDDCHLLQKKCWLRGRNG